MPSTDTHTGNLKAPTYAPGAYCRNAIPRQQALETQDGFTRAVGGTDYLERLPWGDYAGLDIHLDVDDVEAYQERQASEQQYSAVGDWTHIQSPRDTMKMRWVLLFTFAGAFVDYWSLKLFLACALVADIAAHIKFGMFNGTYLVAIVFGLHLFCRYPLRWLVGRYGHHLVKDRGCGFFRASGMVKFRIWKEETFEAPFVEFDPYITFHVSPKGPVTHKLELRHRYTGWQTVVAATGHLTTTHLYAHWDELQRYMDVSQPLPDVPTLEPYRHLDPTTAEYDAAGKRGRPADYWATMDLEWWEKEGYPAHMEKIRSFPWKSLKDRMAQSVPNLNAGSYIPEVGYQTFL